MKGGLVSLELDRPPNVLDGNFMLADLVGQHAEQMPRVNLVRLGGENLTINLLGRLQLARLMMLDGKRSALGIVDMVVSQAY